MMKILTVGLILGAIVAQGETRILVHGHRGARAVRPENTMAGFRYAIEAGAGFLELDLAVTKDNVLVVSHDPILPKAICTGGKGTRTIRKMTLAELKQWDCGSKTNPDFPRQKPVPGEKPPTLDEVLALAGSGEFGFNIEIKVPDKKSLAPTVDEFARLVVEAVRRHKLEKRVLIQSFDFRATRAVKKIAPELRCAALYGDKKGDYVELAREAQAEIIAPNFNTVTPKKVKQAHEAGLEVVPWTANEPPEWKALVSAGVDAIITDDPAGLIAWLKKHPSK